jgi:hypothetical protein
MLPTLYFLLASFNPEDGSSTVTYCNAWHHIPDDSSFIGFQMLLATYPIYYTIHDQNITQRWYQE